MCGRAKEQYSQRWYLAPRAVKCLLGPGGSGIDCMYSFSADENRLSMILLRSTVSPDPTADRGTHTIRYAFCPHVRTWTDADISNVAKAIAVEAVKSAEDGRGFILRCYESKGTRGTVNVVFDTVTLQFASRCPGGAQSAIFITSFKADRDSSGGSTTSVRSAYV